MESRFKLGADPEFFVFKDGKPFPAIGLVSGTKEEPQSISDKGHSVQVDNVLLEFNIPPSITGEDMFNNINFVLDWFKENLKGYSFNFEASQYFDEEHLTTEKAKEFGCDPDWDVWRQAENHGPEDGETNLRVAGGHIHVSYPNHNIGKSVEYVKAFDLFLGVPSILFDNNTIRRSMYGKAGSFRFKKYGKKEGGFEYRVLSNFWIVSQEYVNWIFKQVNKAFDFIEQGNSIDTKSETAERIIKAINSSDTEMAKELIKEFNI